MLRCTVRAAIVTLIAAVALQGQSHATRAFDFRDLARVRQPQNVLLSPDGRWVSYVLGDSLWLAPAHPATNPAGVARAVSDGMSNQTQYESPFEAWSPTGAQLLYRAGGGSFRVQGDVYVLDVRSGHSHRRLSDTLARQLATFVHSSADGPAWSPDGRQVAFVAAERTGRSSSHLQLYVTDVASGRSRIVATDTVGPFGGITSARWSPDGRWLAYTSGSFQGKRGRVVLLPVHGEEYAAPTTVLEGGSSLYRSAQWSPDGHLLAVRARNGRAILLKIDRGQLVDSVRYPGVLRRLIGWVDETPTVIGQIAHGMSTSLAAANLQTGEVVALTGPDSLFRPVGIANSMQGTLIAYTAESGALPLDVWTAFVAPGARSIRTRHQVTHANDWLSGVRLAPSRVVHWVVNDTDTLSVQLFLPPTPSTTRRGSRVPLVVMPYGGYQNEFPKSEYFLSAGIELLAAHGFAVALPNTRGTATDPGWGRNYGATQLGDTEALLDTLEKAGLIDRRRIAVIGHSHGGAMAYYYLTHSARFCGVVATNGWSDWSEISDRLVDGEAGIAAKLRAESPLLNARRATAALLAVSGAEDTQVLPHNARDMVDTLRALGKSAELLAFTREGHLLERPEHVEQFWRATLDFLDAHCE